MFQNPWDNLPLWTLEDGRTAYKQRYMGFKRQAGGGRSLAEGNCSSEGIGRGVVGWWGHVGSVRPPRRRTSVARLHVVTEAPVDAVNTCRKENIKYNNFDVLLTIYTTLLGISKGSLSPAPSCRPPWDPVLVKTFLILFPMVFVHLKDSIVVLSLFQGGVTLVQIWITLL